MPLPDLGRSPFTVTAWVRTAAGGTVFATAPAQGNWARQGKSFFIRGGRLAFDIGWVGCVEGRRQVADGQWHHVAVAKGGQLRFYVDGQPDATGTLDFQPGPAGHVARLGATSPNFPMPSHLKGDLDDVRVYGRALADAEVAADREGPQAGLVARWTFDADGADATGNGNDVVIPQGVALIEGKAGKALRLDGRGGLALPEGGASPADRLWALLERDFADAASRQEMAWERADGIWQEKGDRLLFLSPAGPPQKSSLSPFCELALARRYAAAVERPATLAAQARELAQRADSPQALAKVRELYLASRRHAEALRHVAAFDLDGLRANINTLYQDRAERDALLGRLDALEQQAAKWAGGEANAQGLDAWKQAVETLRREALIARNPLLDFDEIVFVRRLTYDSNHYYTEYINSSWKPGGNLCVLNLRTGAVRELCPSLKGGVFERFDLSFDARRIVFAWKGAHQEGYRIYEVGVDGSSLRQLTFPQDNEKWLVEQYRARPHYHHGTDDMHPCYLADGGIAFISTRCQYGILCDGPDDFTTTVLYRMDADGRNLRKLSNSSVSEASPVLMPDGRLLYTRWEYVDKGAVSVKCLWAMYPDGSMSSEVYANDISLPPTFIYGRPIPNEPNHYVVLGTPHCPQNGVGTVIRLNMSGGSIRTRDPMTYLTPDVDIRAEGGFAFRQGDGPWQGDGRGQGRLFKDPYPLSKSHFLVAHKPAGPAWTDPKGYGIYLLDETGRVELIYRDPDISCWQPYPLRPRQVPPVLETARDPDLAAKGLARCVVADVYHGLAVERGTVKHLRILEQVPRPWAARRRWGGDEYDQQHVVITKDTHLGLKVQHGVVPVESDGSAHFLVPAGKNIFFQALDANHMAVQTERTFVNYMPGETRSCVGCHETPDQAPALGALKALARAPSAPGPQPGEKAGARPLHYPSDVQPVLDKHCVKCHSVGGTSVSRVPPVGGTSLSRVPPNGLDLSGALTPLFSVSYESLVPERRGGKGRRRFDLLGPTIGENHPKTGNVHYLPAKSLGSHASTLVAMLSKGLVKLADPKQAEAVARLAEQHKDIPLAPEELLKLRPGGLLVVSTPNVSSIRSRFRFLMSGFHNKFKRPLDESAPSPSHHVTPISFPWLRYMLHTNGFRIAAVRANRIKLASLPHAVFYPFSALYTALSFARERDRAQRGRNWEVFRTLFSAAVFFGETLVVAARKAPAAEP